MTRPLGRFRTVVRKEDKYNRDGNSNLNIANHFLFPQNLLQLLGWQQIALAASSKDGCSAIFRAGFILISMDANFCVNRSCSYSVNDH